MTIHTAISALERETICRPYPPAPCDIDATTTEAASLARAGKRRPADPALDETVINYILPRPKPA